MAAGKRLVVDASVARSAGRVPVPGFVSGQCRAVLDTILEARHLIALDAEGLREWRKHRSGYAQSWLVRMFARKLTLLLGDVRDEQLRERIRCSAAKPSDRSALDKDCHLVETALKADRIVISRDEIVRKLFKEASSRVAELEHILWANPEIEAEGTVAWIRAGAKLERVRRLGGG